MLRRIFGSKNILGAHPPTLLKKFVSKLCFGRSCEYIDSLTRIPAAHLVEKKIVSELCFGCSCEYIDPYPCCSFQENQVRVVVVIVIVVNVI